MDLSSASADKEKFKLCDCEACTFRRFQMLAHVESQPENKMVCAALPEQNAPSVTTLQ